MPSRNPTAFVIGCSSIVGAKSVTLNDADSWAIVNALRIAAASHKKDAETFEAEPNIPPPSRARLVDQARSSAAKAELLADKLEGVL